MSDSVVEMELGENHRLSPPKNQIP
uniref:Ribosomal protein L16 n=1 Tax=Viscum articulatum TaxID=50172 RepID=A0A7T1TVG7_9MAGN|nr:ribosomal protein L16 [Viscum articulatum]QPP20732.1 ribosomal protein L16 [Viscum articulatum]